MTQEVGIQYVQQVILPVV